MLWGNYKLFQVKGQGRFCNSAEIDKIEIIKKQLVSVSRYYQNPINEILSLWTDGQLKDYAFHSLQNFVPKDELQTALERTIVEYVNQNGVDINKCMIEHLSHSLQFVSGIGQRKANFLLEILHKENKEGISSKNELKKYLGPNVYSNSVAFL